MRLKGLILPVIISICVLTGIVVLSCDEGSKTILPIPVGSSGPGKLYMYGTAEEYTGNLGGRLGADAKCATASNKPAAVTTAHALISVSAIDAIDDMPVNYSFPGSVDIVGPDGSTVIADNWADLVDGTIGVRLKDAGILYTLVKGLSWWSGSDGTGELAANTCSGWVSESNAANGNAGWSDSTSDSWLDWTSYACDSTFNIVCIGY